MAIASDFSGGILRASLVAALCAILGLSACGGGGGAHAWPAIAVIASPTTGQSLAPGARLNITANVNNDESSSGVTWSLTGEGVLTNPAAYSVTYTAPSIVSGNTFAVVTATSVASSASVSYVPVTVVPVGSFANVQPVSVDGGPVAGRIYPNGGFTSVTVCVPGTINCVTIDGILVDTGSTGLRILASALPALPAAADSNGNALSECFVSRDQSYLWGQVALADVRIAGEVAGSLSIQSIGDPAGFPIPSDCAGQGAGSDESTQLALGANGILGIGPEPQDCGLLCDPASGGTPPGPAYYTCAAGSCHAAFVPLAQQVTHPALLFAKDNNGLSLQFPAITAGASTVTGSLTFGIGTQTNNVLGNAAVFSLDTNDNLAVDLVSTGQNLTASFIDSGSNAFFFPDSQLPGCADPNAAYFCPASSTAVSAINTDVNGQQSTINFTVDNADTLLSNNPVGAVFNSLAGPNGSGSCSGGSGDCTFDWGLPFFYGRDVFVSIRGQSVPQTEPAAPWFAYTTGFSK